MERRYRSEAWERRESKRAHGIDFWGMCSARALARRGRRALPGAVHGGVAVAAAWAALEWRLRGEVSSPGFGVERRWRSEAWERGESKRAHEIDFWGMCSARALARRGRRLLQRACHHDDEVAAARMFLGSATRVARPGGSSARQQAGEEEQSDAWVPARGELMAGKALHGAGGRRCRWTATRSRAGRWEMGIRVVLKFPKIPGTKL